MFICVITLVHTANSLEELNKAFKPNTKCVLAETIANPAIVVLDIEKFANAAHSHGVPLIIDNTFATPMNCNPFKWGADIVTHSTTKYMDGHGLTVGGAIVDSGNFGTNQSIKHIAYAVNAGETYKFKPVQPIPEKVDSIRLHKRGAD